MRIELYYFDGCPNWVVAHERLSEALARTDRSDISVERRKVATPSQAEEVGFTGSPTIRIDDRDPFARGDEQIGLACRLYATPDGLGGSPTVEQFIEVLS